MKIALVITTYNQAKNFTRAVTTARETTQSELKFYLFLHSEHVDVVEVFAEQSRESDVVPFPRKDNRGLANAWNTGILKGYEDGADVVIVASDSTWFSPSDLDKVAKGAMENRSRPLIFCEGFTGWSEEVLESAKLLRFGCFGLNPVALEGVGCFDENFWPLNAEDVDYFARVGRVSLGSYIVPDTGICRLRNASKRAATAEEIKQWRVWSSLEYFEAKWGRKPFERGEIYSHPFDDPELSWYIAPQNRSTPYPGHNKYDVGIHQADILTDLIHKGGYRQVAEVGVHKGDTAERVLQACPDLKAYYMVDPWASYEWSDQSHLAPWTTEQQEETYQLALSRVKNFPASRVMRMTSVEAAKRFELGSLDLVFIDANHSYESVKQDLEAWVPLVRPGGVVSGHDYNGFAGVTPAVDEHFPDTELGEYFRVDAAGRLGGTFVARV